MNNQTPISSAELRDEAREGARRLRENFVAVSKRLAEAEAEIERLRAALEPFTAGCFWDNGDLTVDRGTPSLDDVKHAFWVLRKSP